MVWNFDVGPGRLRKVAPKRLSKRRMAAGIGCHAIVRPLTDTPICDVGRGRVVPKAAMRATFDPTAECKLATKRRRFLKFRKFTRRGARKRCDFLSWARTNPAPGPIKGRMLHGLDREYYSVDDYHLTNGLRAALP